MKRVIHAVLISTAVLSFSPALAANYGSVSSKNPGYLVDSSGNIIKSSRTGHCVRLGRHWAPTLASSNCKTPVTSQSRGR